MSSEKPSGAEFRRRQREAEQHAREEQAARGDASPHLARLADLGAPPGDAVAGVEWAARVGLELLHQTITGPAIDERQRRKEALELLKAIAQATPRAVVAERIGQLQGKAGIGRVERADYPRVLIPPGTKVLRGASRHFGRPSAPAPLPPLDGDNRNPPAPTGEARGDGARPSAPRRARDGDEG